MTPVPLTCGRAFDDNHVTSMTCVMHTNDDNGITSDSNNIRSHYVT